MSDAAARAMETRIDAALFGRRYWITPGLRKAKRSSVVARVDQSDHVCFWQVEVTPAEAATYDDIWGHREFCSDWSLIPKLLEQCVKRAWGIEQDYTPTASESWFVALEFDDGGDEYNACDAYADSLPLALCRAIVAVLDALEETTKATKARND